MKGSSARLPPTIAVAPRIQKTLSRQSLCRVRRINVQITNGPSERVNHETVVTPVIKKAMPSQSARLRVRECTKSTRASSKSGIHGEKRYGKCESRWKRYGTKAKTIPAIHATP